MIETGRACLRSVILLFKPETNNLMSSKILSFICHVPGMVSGAYSSAAPAAVATPPRSTPRRAEAQNTLGHFTAIYENERFVRFKYINNN